MISSVILYIIPASIPRIECLPPLPNLQERLRLAETKYKLGVGNNSSQKSNHYCLTPCLSFSPFYLCFEPREAKLIKGHYEVNEIMKVNLFGGKKKKDMRETAQRSGKHALFVCGIDLITSMTWSCTARGTARSDLSSTELVVAPE